MDSEGHAECTALKRCSSSASSFFMPYDAITRLHTPRQEAGGKQAAAAAVGSYEFNRKLLFKLLVMANTQLAELVKARGPNFHINAACAGTTAAIALAQDWMRAGRCRR